MIKEKCNVLLSSAVFFGIFLFTSQAAFAGGCVPGQPCYDDLRNDYQRPARVAPPVVDTEVIPPAAPSYEAPVVSKRNAHKMEEKSTGKMYFGIGPSINTLFFDCEDTAVAPGIYADIGRTDFPINFRVGVEGTTFDMKQHEFTAGTELGGMPNTNFIRIPASLELKVPVTEKTNLFAGGGADLIHVDSSSNETYVGYHAEGRVVRSITENLGLSLNGGYLFADDADIKGPGASADESVRFDSAYVGVQINLNLN